MNFQIALINGGAVGRTVGKSGGLVKNRRTRRAAATKEASRIVAAWAIFFGVKFEDWTDAQIAEAGPMIQKVADKWGVRVDEFGKPSEITQKL